MMNDPQRSPTPNSPGAPGNWDRLPDEDEPALGWECANPALQIERWLQDVTAAPALQSSNS
ncbi:MAG TPA: hypothetical protein VKP68_20105 [Ramlibacter sp.]|nr:hypothetical protein [Ramlibacter sp.]